MTRLSEIRERHANDCIARGVHDATTCARTIFAIAEPACPDVDEHALLAIIRAGEHLAAAIAFLEETDAGAVSPVDANRIVGAGALADLRRALVEFERAVKS